MRDVERLLDVAARASCSRRSSRCPGIRWTSRITSCAVIAVAESSTSAGSSSSFRSLMLLAERRSALKSAPPEMFQMSRPSFCRTLPVIPGMQTRRRASCTCPARPLLPSGNAEMASRRNARIEGILTAHRSVDKRDGFRPGCAAGPQAGVAAAPARRCGVVRHAAVRHGVGAAAASRLEGDDRPVERRAAKQAARDDDSQHALAAGRSGRPASPAPQAPSASAASAAPRRRTSGRPGSRSSSGRPRPGAACFPSRRCGRRPGAARRARRPSATGGRRTRS